ncbi:hypothetical protein ACJRO7_015883 [Eucalyptus globulus]|uniref:Uncharacterized protein n=1 Tax=Eucalyptus globulus TaxID=34317 RepID=A0ABD3LAH0_EUCGL
MASIHPKATLNLPSPTTSHDRTTTEREVFIVWMKSMIMNGKGCTVFDSSDGIVYRVYLMDSGGNVLFTILKESLYEVTVWTDKTQLSYYFIQGHGGTSKSACGITKKLRGLMAELGISLGDEVLTTSVEPEFDHSLAVGLLVVSSAVCDEQVKEKKSSSGFRWGTRS